ncbi:MAG TPA: hypothetical protein DE061_05540 [Clostridiales bacterium]|mgnify:CR=1 FL=1|nr:hypothetical protein [Clostridiales bacterium]
MCWYEYLINALVGLVVGVLSTIITSFLIGRRIKNHDEKKSKLMQIYLQFQKYEHLKMSDVTLTELQDFILEAKSVLFRYKNIRDSFIKYEIVFNENLRLNNGNNVLIINSDDSNYVKLKAEMEKYFGIYEY